jgi:hypothetical protein
MNPLGMWVPTYSPAYLNHSSWRFALSANKDFLEVVVIRQYCLSPQSSEFTQAEKARITPTFIPDSEVNFVLLSQEGTTAITGSPGVSVSRRTALLGVSAGLMG